ncbi:hypothetical protein [Rhodococcus sp. SORGH_AS_0303]|uniref:hypothetical protein n=1 Tax=Rhodococcus sp. SORGH_AS_0303 TaxID=3041753 RepID=UPI002781B827|nr:hypothetical protein [Rhodococcus sp. SORGH_AS_0303]MDQ1202705.1 hypothetical protein [Rhodococcus sp. SORGH_AS_0303]
MTEFHGGPVARDHEVWTACVGNAEGYEEIDVMVPRGSDTAAIRAEVQAVLDADYAPGLVIVDLSPFRGALVWGSR